MRRIPWIVFGLVDGLVLGAVAVGYAAVHLNPRVFWWAELVAVALPYLALAVLLLGLIPLAARRWGWVALHAVALLVLAPRIVPVERLQPRPRAAEDDLVLMTFNVPRHGRSAEELRDQVTALLEAEQPDYVALQETWTWRRRRSPRLEVTSYVRPALDSLRYRLDAPAGVGRVTKQPVLSRRPGGPVVLDQKQTVLTVGGVADTAATHFVRSYIRWQGREAVHYNVHLRSFGTEKPWEGNVSVLRPTTWIPFLRRYRDAYRVRAWEVEQIIEHLREETLPVIITGDFNATPYNWGYHQLARGRIDAFHVAGRGWGGTYHAHLPLVRIDHVLVDPAFEVVAAHVPDVRFSDHRPVVVRLRWRDEE